MRKKNICSRPRPKVSTMKFRQHVVKCGKAHRRKENMNK